MLSKYTFEMNSYYKYLLTSVLPSFFWVLRGKGKERVYARIRNVVHSFTKIVGNRHSNSYRNLSHLTTFKIISYTISIAFIAWLLPLNVVCLDVGVCIFCRINALSSWILRSLDHYQPWWQPNKRMATTKRSPKYRRSFFLG